MLYAITAGVKILATKHARAICPLCNGLVIAKCGDINVHHWAHKNIIDCDNWYEPESEWHLNWKSLFPKGCVEVKMESLGQRHRADILTVNNMVIELQHSSISPAKIKEREIFYDNMIWVFDFTYRRSNFFRRKNSEISLFDFTWIYPRRTLLACKKPIFFDFGKRLLLQVVSFHATGNGIGSFVSKDVLISL